MNGITGIFHGGLNLIINTMMGFEFETKLEPFGVYFFI